MERLCAGNAGRDVYDLMIAGVHEFTASGVIVHNCVWAISELKGLSVAEWGTAYGTHRCAKCSRMFLLKNRKACIHCGHPVAEDDDGPQAATR